MLFQLAATSSRKQEALNLILHFIVISEVCSGQIFFQLREQVVVTEYQVQTIRQVSDDVPSKLPMAGEWWFDGRQWGASVVMENTCTFPQHSSLVLNHLSQHFQCLIVPVSIYCSLQSHKAKSTIPPFWFPKHSCHDNHQTVFIEIFATRAKRNVTSHICCLVSGVKWTPSFITNDN